MRSKVQYVGMIEGVPEIKTYYVRDKFGKVWVSIGKDAKEAKDSVKLGEDIHTYKLYHPKDRDDEGFIMLPKYNFKQLILDAMTLMKFQNTYEYKIVSSWDTTTIETFFRFSSMQPIDLLLDIQKFIQKLYKESKYE